MKNIHPLIIVFLIVITFGLILFFLSKNSVLVPKGNSEDLDYTIH